MFDTLRTVFKKPSYVLIVTLVTSSTYGFVVWLPNTDLIVSVLDSNVTTTIEKLTFLLVLLGSITASTPPFSVVTTILMAILFGVNVALLVYYIQKVKVPALGTATGVGMTGLLSGVLGIGCATCGTFILVPVLLSVGAGGLLLHLPLGGEEFGLLGVVLLLLSNVILIRQIGNRTYPIS